MRSRLRRLSLCLCCLSVATSVFAQQSGPGVLPGRASTDAIIASSITGPATPNGILHEGAVTNPSDATRKVIVRYWDKTTAAASPTVYWTESIASSTNFGTRDNAVFQIGWNVNPGAALIDPSYSGLRDAWEQYYEQATPGIGYWERHVAMDPLDVASNGEIRMISISGRADVTRNNVHPTIAFQGDYFSFTYPSTGGVAFGDSFRITIDGTNFGAALSLNNSSSYISRTGVSKGASFPLFFQQNIAQNANLPVLFFGATNPATNDDLHLMYNGSATTVVHVGIGGAQSRFIVDGLNSANSHGQVVFRDEQGSGTKESFIVQDGTAIYIGAPQSALANYNDATLSAAANMKVTAAGMASIAYTVATLPTCGASTKAAIAYVSDSNATTFHATVAGGGANNIMVVCDGTAWKIGG